MFKIGIDLGYGFLKGINDNGKSIVLPSLISMGYDRSTASIFNNNLFSNNKELLDNLYISLANFDKTEDRLISQNDYYVGELARRQPINSSFNLSDNKILDEETRVLLATGVALLMPDNDVPIHISTGLPLEQYTHLKKEFEDMLKNFKCIVTFKGINKVKVVKFDKVTTFIQGGGAMYHCIMDNFEKYALRNTYIGLIDPGEKTTNYLAFYVTPNGKLSFQEELSGTIDIGMSRIKVAMDKLYSSANYGKKLDTTELTTLCKEGKIYSVDHFIDMTETLDMVKSEIARAIKNKVMSVWNSKIDMFSTIFAAGGGSIELYDYLKTINTNLVLAKDAQMANAKGYIKVAEIAEIAEKRNGISK